MLHHLNELPPPTNMATLDKAARAIAMRHGLAKSEIMGRSRLRSIVRARQEVFWIARREGLSLNEIASYFGMDHTTVLHGVRQVERRILERIGDGSTHA